MDGSLQLETLHPNSEWSKAKVNPEPDGIIPDLLRETGKMQDVESCFVRYTIGITHLNIRYQNFYQIVSKQTYGSIE